MQDLPVGVIPDSYEGLNSLQILRIEDQRREAARRRGITYIDNLAEGTLQEEH